jgi:3',5'-cyclic AMP phosphodiesterase CpdA
MKIVHLTDIHVQTAPQLRELTAKRLLGTTNLYLFGRRSKFSEESQRAAVEAAVAEAADVVVITGDLTAQALDAEFSDARALLDPILQSTAAVMIPGNHDTYVREHTPGDRMRELFGEWMGDGMPAVHEFGDVAFLSIETCRLHPLSSGWTPPEQLQAAELALKKLKGKFVFLCIHYPLLSRHGEPYGPASRALANGEQFRQWLSGVSGVSAVLHGHEHHGFTVDIQTADGPIPILNPGACGYSRIPSKDRTAHLNIYEVDSSGISELRRLSFDGDRFVPETGGAYATGR